MDSTVTSPLSPMSVHSSTTSPDESEFKSAVEDLTPRDELFDDISLLENDLAHGEDNGPVPRRDSNVSSNSLTLQENLYSTLSVESLDLDVPLSYKVETVDFPSSPEALKRLAGLTMPVEVAKKYSDEEEEDKSMYQAHLLSNGQDVRLQKNDVPDRRKVIPVPPQDLDISDFSRTEATGYDVDFDENADSPDDIEDSIMSRLGDVEPIPEFPANEEAEESRSWRTYNFAGVDCKIDLRVLEPYKRVVSHGGYLSSGSRNAIIVFSACYLPDRSRVDYDYVMSNLFMYVISTLDQLVTDDYIIVYLHGATQRSSMPKFSWLKQCYLMIDRKLRKNLKGLYLVHPTFWLKTLTIMTKPFISSKFSKKLFFVSSLSELLRRVPLERASIPDRVVKYDYELHNEDSVLNF